MHDPYFTPFHRSNNYSVCFLQKCYLEILVGNDFNNAGGFGPFIGRTHV